MKQIVHLRCWVIKISFHFKPSFKCVAETIVFKNYNFICKFKDKYFSIYIQHMFCELQDCGKSSYDTYIKIMSCSDDLFDDYNAAVQRLGEVLYKSDILAKIS